MKIEILQRVDKAISVIVYQNDMIKDVYILLNSQGVLDVLKHLNEKGEFFNEQSIYKRRNNTI